VLKLQPVTDIKELTAAKKNYRTLRITAVTLPRISQLFPSIGAKLSFAGSSQIWPFLRENVLTVASPSIMAATISPLLQSF
jgi:hypothetical protein